ncbi:acyltransferase family protein [Ornithinibacillus halophilus]|uniref:Predicted acyltransferase n=1 Tax=Ornithinibacillus halophilus TaxID=930117 RepID=A0A1M5GRF1_9BACI|nr:heparan-alpha-glucosaminide N-acetyltransferase domain-containing protein [Ornithinibacillus halophilus]SHG06295.1 Predicted acyltransferase [Ornithinibacillus halophilus]
MVNNNTKKKNKRILSVDITRGLLVASAVFLSNIPSGGYEWARHAQWYGLTVIDLIFPGFLTLFGVGIALAYRDRIKWKKVIRRTIILIVIGLLYNGIVNWSLDVTTWRLTGVLQLYAVVGLVVVLLIWINRSWLYAIVISVTILFTYAALLYTTSSSCTGGLLTPDCFPLFKIDTLIFGETHLYGQGDRGFDPEGIFTMLSATANVMFGFAAGRLILDKRDKGVTKSLFFLAVGISCLVPILLYFAPIGKRIWTPSFAATSAAFTIFLLAIFYAIIDRKAQQELPKFPGLYVIEAFGKNSLLIYFGKDVVTSLSRNIMVPTENGSISIRNFIVQLFSEVVAYPKLLYAVFLLTCWTIIAYMLHRKKIYIKA